MPNILKLILSILLCQAAGGLGALATTPAIKGWYAGLQKPGFNPPNWIFGPVWTLLYTLMGISFYLAWTHGFTRRFLAAFFAQLALNVLWSTIFFGLHKPAWGLACIAALWAAILWTILELYPVSTAASLMQIPYLAWVSFASLLNFFLWKLNH